MGTDITRDEPRSEPRTVPRTVPFYKAKILYVIHMAAYIDTSNYMYNNHDGDIDYLNSLKHGGYKKILLTVKKINTIIYITYKIILFSYQNK